MSRAAVRLIMSLGKLRTLALFACLAAAGSMALLNCAPAEEESEEESGEDAVTGVNNALGLALVYDADSGHVKATLKDGLKPGEQLFLRVRRGVIGQDSEKALNCGELTQAPAAKGGDKLVNGKTIYDGPAVSKEILGLIGLFNDPRWYGGRETAEMKAELDKGPDPIVEACVMKGDKVRAKLLTNLAYAWDRGNELQKNVGALGGQSASIHFNAGDGGGGAGGNFTGPITPEQATQIVAFVNNPSTTIEVLDDRVGLDRRAARNIINRRTQRPFTDINDLDAVPYVSTTVLNKIRNFAVTQQNPQLREGERYSTIDYAKLCVQQLGEIPFFKKIAEGKYDSFDCREFVGTNADGRAQGAIPGVEGAVIPLTVNDQPKETCDPGQGRGQSYDCVSKCDKAMWLTASEHTGLGQKAACQPGVTVTHAKNSQGTNWILLCRKVQDTGVGMMKTKKFNDIAIIGNNPQTGNTCYFQNKENIGNDGARVTHPADVTRSSAIWPSEPSSYCTKNCHAADAFIHSPWIDGAKRRDGKTIVPKFGEQPDYPISDITKPYRLINGPAQGFGTSPQQVGENVAACTTCHRIAGAAFAEFSEWSTGTGDNYYSKITDPYKAFEKSHYMPLRLDGLTAANFDSSPYGKAVKALRTCSDDPNAAGCEFATVPER
jgi:hypothetical protein